MRINLYTDAPKHNLALMKISAYHKAQGDIVTLNMPIMPCDYSYASILFEKNINMFNADEYGGIAYVDGLRSKKEDRIQQTLRPESENCNVDYGLYNLDYSLGYTYRPCFRRCPFCKVWKANQPDIRHHSIYDFHTHNLPTKDGLSYTILS